MPELIDPVFTKTSPKRSFSLSRKRAFWLVFAKTGSIISGPDPAYECGPDPEHASETGLCPDPEFLFGTVPYLT